MSSLPRLAVLIRGRILGVGSWGSAPESMSTRQTRHSYPWRHGKWLHQPNITGNRDDMGRRSKRAQPYTVLNSSPEQNNRALLGTSRLRWKSPPRCPFASFSQQLRCYCKEFDQEMKSAQGAPAAAAFSARKARTAVGKSCVAEVETAGAQAEHQPKRGDLLLISGD